MLINEDNHSSIWKETTLKSIDEIFQKTQELEERLWVTRGQSMHYSDKLLAPIDRPNIKLKTREEKIERELKSLSIFCHSLRAFSPGEDTAISEINKIPALMLMQHNFLPTRLLDWSLSPFISLFFASNEHLDKDGEIWGFDYNRYYVKASEQWCIFPETKNIEGVFDNSLQSIFTINDPPHAWFVLQFLYKSFTRISSQKGLFSVTSKFGMDHSLAIQDLLEDNIYFHRYIIPKEYKKNILTRLHAD